MGIGIANLSTDAAISAFEDGKGMVVQPAMPSTLQLAHNLFEANICMHGINAGLAEAAAQGGLVTQGGYVQQVPIRFHPKKQKLHMWWSRYQCGSRSPVIIDKLVFHHD